MPDPLSLSPEEMRRLGYAVIDRLVAHAEGLADAPPIRVGEPEALTDAIGGPPPDAPGDAAAELDKLFEQVLPWGQRADHPRFFARIGSPSTYVGALADAAAAGLNAFTGSWTGGSGPSAVELTVLEWLRTWCGMPEGSSGVLTTGGSIASLVGFAAARQAKLAGPRGTGVAYVSDQTHASLPRAVSLLGERTRVLASDAEGRLTADALRRAVAVDREAGLHPFCAVATAGTTSTGAVDPLRELHAACEELGLWLHVDGAYGAPAVLTDTGAALLDGLGLADSLVIDPHKWLFQPYEIGCVLVRDPRLLEQVFALDGAYLRDTGGGAVNFRDRGPELTRGARGLKLWLSVRTFGLDAFRAAIAHGIALAEHAEAQLRARGGWEVVTPAQLGIVTFRREGLGDAAQTRLSAATVADGYAAPSTTIAGGRVVLRLCTINPRTTFEEIDETIARMEALHPDALGG
ncbi:MAG TPA: pyridoxal-dependent decarboxylase [Solirubrobacteraceae bacterium]|nr:pyridoxal-dependent decarboxylase [Solirubrobacteraceae bacterium]